MRRNRKRPAPIWRRTPDLGVCLRLVTRGLYRSLPVFIALVAIALVGVGGYHGYRFVTSSRQLAVRFIDVRGNHNVSSEAIRARLGVAQGDNIFGLELAALASAIEADPMIAQASVRRQLPDTLIVEVEENEPAALVEMEGLYVADSQGRIFKRAAVERGDGAELPVITGLDRAEYVADPEAVQSRIRDALEAVALYASSHVLGERPVLGEINIHPRHGITFTTYERAVAVRVGHGDLDTLRARLHAFDLAWQALSADEQQHARIVYANATTRPDRITIGFDHIASIQ